VVVVVTRLGASDGEDMPPSTSAPATPRGRNVRIKQGVNPLVTRRLVIVSASGGEAADIHIHLFLTGQGYSDLP
jgi:hypothetical protein